MSISATELRTKLYRVLDLVAKTGEAVEISRNGVILKIVLAAPRKKLKRLVRRKGYLKGNPDEIVHMDWSDEWKP